jgi:hypothetical protein
MTIFMDSFDHYATGDVLMKWTSANTMAINATGRNGTNGLQLTSQNGYVAKTLDAQSTWRMGAAWQSPSPTDGNAAIFNLVDSTIVHIELGCDASGHLAVYRGRRNAGGTVLGVGTTVLSPNTWYYVELHAVIHDTTGAVTVRLNEVAEITLTNQDTRNGGNASADIAVVGYGINFTTTSYDDVYILNGSDASAFWGDVRVQSIFPTAEGNSSAWTPSTGTDNSALVDETAPNGDTDYTSSSTTSQKDTFVTSNVTPTSGTVKAVQWLADVRKDDAGARTVCPVYRHSSTDYDGTAQSVLSSYTYLRETTLLNPGTGSAWTISDVNAAEFGIKLVS